MSRQQPEDPIVRFSSLYEEAVKAHPQEYNAMTLATVDERGRPAARVVLLKGFDARGFVFYTNLESRKGRELEARPYAALCFYWPRIDWQVRIEGPVTRVDDAEADTYFASRARGSQLGAWASRQSFPLASRTELEARLEEVTRRFEGHAVERPPFWSGFRVSPERMEFWNAGANRLHDRTVYEARPGGWDTQKLYP